MTELHDNEVIFHDEATDVHRLNTLFDNLTDKRFLTAVIFVAAIRGALDLHGITLPHLDVEGTDGSTVEDGYAIQVGADCPVNPQMYAPPTDGLYVFNVKSQHDLDADSDVYLYMVADRDDEGVYECYAQLVNGDELEELLSTDPLDKEFPELVGDVSGETEWLKQQRHLNGGLSDVDEAPPQG